MRLLCLSVLLLVHSWAGGAELGRLFLSPAQRTAIDDARRGLNREHDPQTSVTDDGATADENVDPITLSVEEP